MTEENYPCPHCGNIVSKTDKFCKNCGTALIESLPSVPTAPPLPQPVPEAPPPYERKFSTLQRYYRLLTAPSEAMKDIALAPDYRGYFGILALQFVSIIVSLVVAMQKFQFTGTYADQITSFLSSILAIAAILATGLLIIEWLVKSLIVRFAGDSGSNWNFTTAASVTGYAYLTDVVFAIIGILILWFIMPTFRVDTTDLTRAMQQTSDYRAQLNMLKLTFSLPFTLLGIAWKSYLGSLGTHFGTNEKCSKLTGFIIFFVLSLLGLLISFITSP